MNRTSSIDSSGVLGDPLPAYDTPRWKRILDLVVMLVSLPVIAPLVVGLALAIKLGSSGPVLFAQTRIGRGGRPFRCFKFRTMKPDASVTGHERHLASLMTSNAPMVKLDQHDPRIVPGGRILRSSGLDELPQLLNVLKGEMSIVGPRPCLPYEYALYNDRHKQRLAVVPGITGLWQVTGKNLTTFEKMIDLDVAYARRQSLALDLSIMLRTGGVLLRQLSEAISRPPGPVAAQPVPAGERG